MIEPLGEYVDDALDPAAADRVEAHVRRCGPCRRYLADVRVILTALAGLRNRWIPAAARREVAADERAY